MFSTSSFRYNTSAVSIQSDSGCNIQTSEEKLLSEAWTLYWAERQISLQPFG